MKKKLIQVLPTLPENIFEFSMNIEQSKNLKKEKIGTETYYEDVKKTKDENYTESYEEGSCFKSTKTRTKTRPIEYTEQELKTRDKYADVEYIELSLPCANLMAKQWSTGITKEKEKLWNILCIWMIERLNYVSESFEKSVIDIINLAECALNEQLKIIESNFEEEKNFWEKFELENNLVIKARQKLEQSCREG